MVKCSFIITFLHASLSACGLTVRTVDGDVGVRGGEGHDAGKGKRENWPARLLPAKAYLHSDVAARYIRRPLRTSELCINSLVNVLGCGAVLSHVSANGDQID